MARKEQKPVVGILMGSDSDLSTMQEARSVLQEAGVPCEIRVLSAHRAPEDTASYAKSAAGRGIKVIIAGAGGAAHLAGVLASHTTLPVIGVPLDATLFKGVDSYLSTLQMPPGIPVATVSIGKWGARNAGILAMEILALGDKKLSVFLKEFKSKLRQGVLEKDRKLQEACCG
ncbi:MAG: 5-(carboxyamino)imidazole ribonucleotide mutase [Candidatus Omnitrophica bacterium]|nr:5-(carboxyamino)imidazole ribonucleotide mutase [Candidatus Omnitrophota bacterium]